MTLKSVLLWLTLGTISLGAAQTGTMTTPTVQQAQQLTERLLQTMSGPNGQVQLTYGLPEVLPVTLQDPVKVLATVRLNYGGSSVVSYRVFARAEQSSLDARETLLNMLEAGGWKGQPSTPTPFGFQGNQVPGYLNMYREGQTHYVLNATFMERNGGADIEMNLNVISAAQLAQLKRTPSYLPRSSLPALKVFPGSQSKATYPSGHPNGSLSSVWVKTQASAGEVLSHYSAQLKAAGWKAVTDTTSGPLRVVTYTLKDLNGREALGTLGLRPWEKDGGYVLTVSVQGFKP